VPWLIAVAQLADREAGQWSIAGELRSARAAPRITAALLSSVHAAMSLSVTRRWLAAVDGRGPVGIAGPEVVRSQLELPSAS
jgi:hypothetical protein